MNAPARAGAYLSSGVLLAAIIQAPHRVPGHHSAGGWSRGRPLAAGIFERAGTIIKPVEIASLPTHACLSRVRLTRTSGPTAAMLRRMLVEAAVFGALRSRPPGTRVDAWRTRLPFGGDRAPTVAFFCLWELAEPRPAAHLFAGYWDARSSTLILRVRAV